MKSDISEMQTDINGMQTDIKELKQGQQRLEKGQERLQNNLVESLGLYTQKIVDHVDVRDEALNKKSV